MNKANIAFYWAASCGGCEIAVLDINEKILDVIEKANILMWPVAMDTKYEDLKKMKDKSIDVCFFNGAIRTSENEELAKLLRNKSKILVAFGSCAHEGCIPALANLFNKKLIFDLAYQETETTINKDNILPQPSFDVKEGEIHIPEFYDTVKTLDQVVDVDYYIPGCPPTPNIVEDAFNKFLTGDLPPKGAVLAPVKALCDECPRKKKDKTIETIYRVYEKEADPEKCFLDQGIICMGPATRSGCGHQCIKGNMPCTGCFGKTPEVTDQGAKMISALASVLAVENETELDEKKVEELVSKIKDPVGTFYRYSLASSLIKRKVIK